MIKTCPICHRDFDTIVSTQLYCNISCRKKANHEKEKEKASAFYQGPKEYDERVLFKLSSPGLEELQTWADILTRFVRASDTEKVVMVYGKPSELWRDNPTICLVSQYGATPPCWAMHCLLSTKESRIREGKVPLLVKPVGPIQKTQVVEAVLDLDKQAEEMLEQLEG